jgi:hypothetical protein
VHKVRERHSDFFNNSVEKLRVDRAELIRCVLKRRFLLDEKRFHVIFNSAGGLIQRQTKICERCASVEYNEISRTPLQYFHDSLLKLRRHVNEARA